MARQQRKDMKRLKAVRDEIARLQNERPDVENAPVSRDEAVAALDRWIARNAALFRDNALPASFLDGQAHANLSVLGVDNRNTLEPALCALAGDRVREFYVAAIDQQLQGVAGLDENERKRRLNEIDNRKHELEREEEQIVRDLEEAGADVQRRGEADPRAVLGLEQPPAAPPAPAREDQTQTVDHGPVRPAPGAHF